MDEHVYDSCEPLVASRTYLLLLQSSSNRYTKRTYHITPMLHTLITSLRTETKRVEKCTWSTYYEASDEVFAPLMLLQYQGLVRSLHKLYRSFGNVWGCFRFNFAMVKTNIKVSFCIFKHILITKIRTSSC